MSDEQIDAALAQERRAATDKIPIEGLVSTVRQTAYALHLYLGTGYLENVYENALTTGIEHGLLINFGSPKFEIVKRIYTKQPPQGEALS